MNYTSTRNNKVEIVSSKAIYEGISTEGGLFVPKNIPEINYLSLLSKKENYPSIASKILNAFLTEYSEEFLNKATCEAYGNPFSNSPAPIKKLQEGLFSLELFHGPTLAFKDIALQLMPKLYLKAKDINNICSKSLILVATSGDTGKAALEGYKNLKGVNIMVFYPCEGVSEIQRLQMCMQEGSNVNVVGVKGNFDDTQRAVKAIMTDKNISLELKKSKIKLGSANSINIGRLLPQIVYYFSSYISLVKYNEIKIDEEINFVVPSGNFGNILAGFYAKKMGLPIKKLICASNVNDVLTDFIKTGEYNANREFFTTISPSMDILVSSNVERLVYIASGNDSKRTNELYNNFLCSEQFKLSDNEHKVLKESFVALKCDDSETKTAIKNVYLEYNYLIDPHTAVGFHAYEEYKDKTPTVIVSTASPYKFADSVLSAFGETYDDMYKRLDRLSYFYNGNIPKNFINFKAKQQRFTKEVEVEEQRDAFFEYVNQIKGN